MPEAWSREINKSNKISWDGVFAEHGIGTLIFMVCLFFGYLFILGSPETSRLTVNELISLADSAETKKDYDREIMHLETVKSRFPSDDPRIKNINERILEAKTLQVKR